MTKKRRNDDSSLTRILRRGNDFNRSQGVLTWGPKAMAQTDDGRLATVEDPRLFISYKWGDIELESWLDFLVGHLVTRGYRVVYDRDPRNFARELSREAVLSGMDRCNYFIAIVNDQLAHRIGGSDLAATTAVTHEWEHAFARARQDLLRLCAIWFSGETLPAPFELATVIDLRPTHTENLWEAMDRYFPGLTGADGKFDPPVVPTSRPHIPGLLNRSGSLIADRYRLVTVCAWKPDGSCDRLGPFLIRQLERTAASLAATGRYTHITTEPAGVSSEADD
jgi:hypothetical protein